MPHVPRHISQTDINVGTNLTSDHHILHLTSHYTAVCLPPPFHTTYHTATVHISHIIPHPQLFHTTPTLVQHHSTFPTTIYSTSHYTTISDITTHCIFFHIWQHNAYATFFINSTPPHFTSHRCHTCIMQHSSYQDTTFHTTPYSTSRILHFGRIPRHTGHVWNCNIPHHTTVRFTYTSHNISHRTIIQIKLLYHISAHHSTLRPHSTSRHAMHITTFKYRTIPPHYSKPHHHSATHRHV